MPPEQKLDLLLAAREHWIAAEVRIYAYEREYHRSEKAARWVKSLGIGLAGLAAVLAAIPASQNIPPWCTAVAAGLSVVVGVLEKGQAPDKIAAYWESRQQLETVKTRLADAARSLDRATAVEGNILDPIVIVLEGIKLPYEKLASDEAAAEALFERRAIAQIIRRYRGDDEENYGERPVEVASDATGMIPGPEPV